MIELQQASVADHIAALEREAGAIRAERERDHRRAHAAAGSDAFDHAADLASRRVRLGRWLVGMGEAIAGSARPVGVENRTLAHAAAGDDDPCGDGNDRLASAA